MKLSIVIPVYDEINTVGEVLALVANKYPQIAKQIVIVDDCSRDGTREWLKKHFPDGGGSYSSIATSSDGSLLLGSEEGSERKGVEIDITYHEANTGKGGALRTGFERVNGDVVIIQDADLEYDPDDWAIMWSLIVEKKVADVVYGSRFFGRPHRSLYYHHYLANRLISSIYNTLFNQTLNDIEVCYKMMRREVVDSLRLTSNDFGIEVEMSAQIAKAKKWRIYEVGISYYGRSYDEGKKINWKDGVKALWYLIKFRLQ